MIAQEWLDRTRAITDQATEGPWAEDGSLIGPRPGASVAQAWGARWKADAEFIAHARTALPQAVAALQAVTDLHQPRSAVTQSASGHPVDTLGPCTACDWDWPCPTVTTIQDTLGDHQ